MHEIEFWDKDGSVISGNVTENNGWEITGRSVWHPGFRLGFAWEVTEFGGITEMRILRSSIREEGGFRFKSIIPDAGRASAIEGDGSSLVMPFEHGMLCYCKDKPEGEMALPVYSTWPSHCNMTLYGVCGNGRALVMIMEDGKFDADFRIRTNWGSEHCYSIDARFWLRDYIDDELPGDDLVIRSRKITGSWQDMAKFYRKYVQAERGIPTLREKLEINPTLQYSVGAMTVRFRMCVKKLPTPILEQTADNQPPMTVFLTFDMAGNIIREFKRQMMGPCELNLVGWNFGGHDGAFPQLFPAEERIGGDDGLDALLKTADECGFPLSLHDNYFDVYTLADSFREDYVNRNHDGSMTLGGQYGGGQAYQACPRCACEYYAPDNFEKMKKLGVSGVYFSDVISIAQLTRCYSPEHPLTRRENAVWWKKIMQAEHDIFGGSMSEGAREWALPELDRAYLVGLCMDRKKPYFDEEAKTPFSYFDEEIPLFQMVYHGLLLYNSYRDGVNSFPGDDIYLRNFAYGGIPLYYYHHIFNPAWGDNDGWGSDLRYSTNEQLAKDAARIKQASDDTTRCVGLQTEFIDDFITHSPTLTETVYSNGTSVWVNYGDASVDSSKGQVIPPHDFIVE